LILEHICANIVECRARIENDFQVDLVANERTATVFLRGEHFPYEKTESSMKRFLTAEDGRTIKPLYYVSPFIDFEDIYAEYHSTQHDLDDEEGAGFLQHYGFPTDLFDLSPSFETARFFAATGRENEPIGVIGVFVGKELNEHFKITNLSRHPFAQRPRNQLAYAARPNPGISDLKNPNCDRLFTSKWYRFYKTQDDFAFAADRACLNYPSEGEIAYFFGQDFDEFFRTHWAYQEMAEEQCRLVHDKLDSIRNQLK
jgi:hypothetical protein